MTALTLNSLQERYRQRGSIDTLEAYLREAVRSGEFEQTIFGGGSVEGDLQCDHAFGDGVYCRGLWIPQGTCVIGRIHKQARVVIVASGRCVFADEFHTRDVEGPWMGEFRPHSKTAVYAHTDSYWVACLGTELKDSRDAFHLLTSGTHAEHQAFLQKQEKLK